MSDTCGVYSSINQYLLGNMIRLSVSFQDSEGELVDPTSVTLEIKRPDGVTEMPTPSKEAVGKYYFDYTPSVIGMHYYNFQGFGAVVAMSQGQFLILAQSI